VKNKLWQQYGIGLTLNVLVAIVVLFFSVSFLVWITSKVARLGREDFIAALFCSVKKTLAMGVPLAHLIFGANANLGLILLPIMFYHPFQLFVCGLLASHFSHQKEVIDQRQQSLAGSASGGTWSPRRWFNNVER